MIGMCRIEELKKAIEDALKEHDEKHQNQNQWVIYGPGINRMVREEMLNEINKNG